MKWKFSSCFCTKLNGNIANLSAWFLIDCSTHVVNVDDWDHASMEVESLGSLNSCILIILDLLRWSHGRTCARSRQSWEFPWAGWLVFNGQVRIASIETAENVGHVFLLLKWSPGIVRLDWSGWFMSSYCLDMSCFNSRPNTLVGQVGNNWGCEWHCFHHIYKSGLANRRITEPGILANSELQTFCRVIHRCYHAGRLGGFYFPANF